MSKNKDKDKEKENKKYGEFICSTFEWVSLDKQKEIAEKLNNITKNKK